MSWFRRLWAGLPEYVPTEKEAEGIVWGGVVVGVVIIALCAAMGYRIGAEWGQWIGGIIGFGICMLIPQIRSALLIMILFVVIGIALLFAVTFILKTYEPSNPPVPNATTTQQVTPSPTDTSTGP